MIGPAGPPDGFTDHRLRAIELLTACHDELENGRSDLVPMVALKIVSEVLRMPTAHPSLVGEPAVEMPDIVGMSDGEARSALQLLGIAFSVRNEALPRRGRWTEASGLVVAQTPAPGALIGLSTQRGEMRRPTITLNRT